MRILLTGAAGYVGHQIALRLHAAGHHVLGSSRRALAPDMAARLDLPGLELVAGDHLAPEFLEPLVARVDAVVHAAARVRGHSPRSFEADNQRLTGLLATLAQRHARPLVFLSSDQAVYLTGPYGRSKRACEAILASAAPGGHAVLRLSAVLGRYAPQMASTFSKIIARLAGSRLLLVPGDAGFPISPVWIGDVARAISGLLALDPRPQDPVFELCGPTLELRELIDLFEARLGTRRRRVPLPLGPMQRLARLVKPLPLASRLPLDALLGLGAPIRVSSARLSEVLGLRPIEMARAVAQIEDFPELGAASGARPRG